MKFGGQIRNIDVNFRSDRPLAQARPVLRQKFKSLHEKKRVCAKEHSALI